MLARSSDNRLGYEPIELIYLALLAFVVIADLWLEFASHLRWSNPKRFLTISCSVLIVSFWLVMLQADWFVSGLPSALCWGLILSTVFVSVKLAYELDNPQESRERFSSAEFV